VEIGGDLEIALARHSVAGARPRTDHIHGESHAIHRHWHRPHGGRLNRTYLLVPAQAMVAQHLQTYVDYPPRQKPGSFSLDQVLQKLQ
jgi:hypothetical protein